jgi:hypothetical protein
VGLGEGDFVIVDGMLILTDRVRPDEPYYSQKHKKHGMNVQVLTTPDGTPLWFSRATPGRTHDLTAARAHGIIQACLARPLLIPGRRSHRPHPRYGHRELPEHHQQYNRAHAHLRASGERAFAQLKSWRLLRRARCSTNRLGRIVRAVHTLLICKNSGGSLTRVSKIRGQSPPPADPAPACGADFGIR